jgi:pimeloyl-ACP methyl ester carboxylesterase
MDSLQVAGSEAEERPPRIDRLGALARTRVGVVGLGRICAGLSLGLILHRMEATARDGVRLWWNASGSGSPVLLVPGRGDSTDIFPRRFTDRLIRSRCRVIRFDPRDTGLSGDCGSEYTLTDLADDALAALDAADASAAHLVGLSMAGLLIVDLAIRAPARLLSITLLSAVSPDPEAGIGEDFFDLMDDDPDGTIIRAMGPTTDEDRVWVAREIADAARRAPPRPAADQYHQEAAYRSTWPTKEQLSAVRAPCLVIHGSADRTLPLRHGLAFHEGIPASELVVMDGMGHLPRPAEWDAIAERVSHHIVQDGA